MNLRPKASGSEGRTPILIPRAKFASIVGEVIGLVKADCQSNAIKLMTVQLGCSVFRARFAVDVAANLLAKVDPSIVPFRVIKLRRRKR